MATQDEPHLGKPHCARLFRTVRRQWPVQEAAPHTKVHILAGTQCLPLEHASSAVSDHTVEIVVGIIGAGVGAAIAILSNTVLTKWKIKWEEAARKRETKRNAVLSKMNACGKLVSIMNTIYALGAATNMPYYIKDSDSDDLRVFFQESGHLLSDELQAQHIKFLSTSRTSGSDPWAPILKKMHELAKSEYGELERQYARMD